MTLRSHKPGTSVVKVRGERAPLSSDPTYAQLLREIGGAKGLKDLALHSSRPEARKLLMLCEDPAYGKWGGKRLAQLANLTFKDLIEMRNERAMLLAVSNIVVEHVGEILQGAAEDAKPSVEVCPKCWGVGSIRDDEDSPPELCPRCRGKKEVRIKGDKDAMKFVGEVTGLVKGAGGNVTNVTVPVQVNNPQGSFEELVKKAGKVITVEARKVD